jgi:hypothetical protein
MLNASHLDAETLGMIRRPDQMLVEAMAAAFVLLWLTGLVVYIQGLKRPTRWILVGKFGPGLHRDRPLLFESITGLRKEWRYQDGYRWVYPSHEDLLAYGRDVNDDPLFIEQR